MTASKESSQSPRRGVLHHLGLHRPELRAWAMYDWANSAFMTTIIAAIFPAFFAAVPGEGLPQGVAMARYGTVTTISILIAAVMSPVMGAAADIRAVKKPLLGMFVGIGALACVLMFFIHHGDLYLAMVLFGAGNIAIMGSFVLYESLLPHIARNEEIDRVSMGGFALGYLGGGLLLALNLAWILSPGLFNLPAGGNLTPAEQTLPVRLALASVGIWWLLFSIPLFLKVPEPSVVVRPGERRKGGALRIAFSRLAGTFRELKGYRNAFLMLFAFLIYSDGIGTIIRMATIYGAEIGIDRDAMITAILITQFVGFPFAFLFGALAGWIGTKRAIFLGLGVYVMITFLAFFMTAAVHFLALAVLVGMVQGGTQGLSRSLFATIIPRHKSGEFFGFFGVMDRFSGSMGSALLILVITVGAPLRWGILAIAIFFVLGGLILLRVDVAEGQAAAHAEDARMQKAQQSALGSSRGGNHLADSPE